jgi:hypothetical protein
MEETSIIEQLLGTADLTSAAIGAGAVVIVLLIKKFVPADKIPLIKNFIKKTDEELNKDG